MLEFDGPVGQYFSRSPTISQRRRVGEEEERHGVDLKSKSK